MRTPLIIAVLILCAGNFLFAQAPNISYASTPASLLINTAVGTAPNPSLSITNTGGAIPAAIYTSTTFAGSTSGTAGRANATGTSASFSGPNGITVDGSGNFYIADQTNNEIRKMTSAGVVTLLAGNSSGTAGIGNGTGSAAFFSSPKDVTTDNTNVYVADFTNNEIRKIVISTGVVTLLAGSTTGVAGRANGTTTAATFSGPAGIAYSSTATAMYVSDYTNNEIRKVTTAGVVTLLAGSSTGASGMANGTTTAASFNHPTGMAVDASGNIYVADQGNNQIRKVTSAGVVTLFAGSATGVAGSADGTGSAATFNAPAGVAVDAAGLIYVYDSGTDLIRQITSGGVVTTVSGSGTSGFTNGINTVSQFNGAGLVTDASKNLFLADFSNNVIRKVTITPSFTVSPTLPTGLTLNAVTGAITGTPTVSTTPTNYTITAFNESGNGTATLNLNVYNKRAWTGGTSTAWLTTTNWSGSTLPSTWDQVTIGSTTAYTNLPLITTTVTVGSIIMGTSDNGTSPSITVTSPGILNVTNDITYQSDASSLTNNTFVASLTGTGVINAKNLNIIANTVLNSYTLKLTSSVTSLNLSGDINLTSTYTSSSQVDNSTFTISSGTVAATNLNTTNGSNASSTSTLIMTGGTLNLTDPNALSGLSANGTNTFTLSSGSTIGYTASAAQTVYTSTAITGLPSGISYQNLTLSGSGIKTAASGNLNIAGSFTNSLANDVSNYLDASGATVVFNGTSAQALAGGSGTGTNLKNVTFSGNSTKTISSGKINVISTGTLTLSGTTTTLATGGFLTLKSDANGSAIVAAIPSGTSITGNVNVERYIQGGQAYSRGYRLISSPVSVSSGSLIYPNLTYISANTYTTGTTGTSGGFDATGNPTMYLYREDIAPNFSTFISGNSRGINKINNTTTSNFNIDTDGSPFTIPAGNGVLLFFRGDKATTVNPTLTNTVALATTFTATGYLNQGSIVAKDWFTPTQSILSYTPATPVSVQGFNLLGNPYASSIDWELMTGGTNISNTIWVYNPKYKAYAVYVRGNSGIGTSADGATSNIIPSGQGFFIKTTGASPAFTFTEAHKVSTQVPASNLMLSAASNNAAAIQYIRVVLSQDSLTRDDALLFFKSSASPDYLIDEDAEYLMGLSKVHISTQSTNNHNLAVNQMPFPAIRQQIGLNVNVSSSGTYKLDLSEAKNIPSRYKIFLTDAYKKDSVDIKKQPVYTFNADTTNASTFGSNRFHLVIGQNPDSAYRLVELLAAKSLTGVSLIWKTVNESTNINFTIERSNDGGATYSIVGALPSAGLGTYSFVDKSPQTGVNIYRLKQEDIYGGLSYTQVSINYSTGNTAGVNSVSVYPNPASSTIKLTIAEISKAIPDNTLPDYTISISNSRGNIIKSASTSQPAVWQTDVSSFVPGMYFLRVINNNTKTVVGNSKFVKL